MLDRTRPLERWLARRDGRVMCPHTQTQVASCKGCPFFCRNDAPTASVVCSYPIAARDTFAHRATRDQATRIALSHHLERT